MSELANFFVLQENIAVHLVMYGKNPDVFYTLHPKINIHVPTEHFNDSLRTIYSIKRMLYLRKTVKKIQPDTLLSFGEYWNNFALLALKGLRFPVYVSDRCQPDKQFSRFHNILRKWLYPTATGIIAQTKTAKEIIFKHFKHKNIEVIGNPIRRLKHLTIIEKENWIITVGRLITTKHHDLLIRIFSKLNAPGWKLIIIGGNALKQNNLESLKNLIEKMNLKDKVVLTGELSGIDEYYQKSKIFAFTSSSEGFPNVVGEALSAGLPVISYDCIAGPSEMIVDGENGFLVPVFDDEQFQEKLQQLIDNENLREQMAEKAKESIKRFSVETIGEQYLDFILSKS